jgi:DNA helicase-2/ATP-dependent DNA helicase PcrA
VVSDGFEVYNFGASKGKTFDRVLIYPTKDMLDWINDNNKNLKSVVRAKFYVAITRARFSVGIVYDFSQMNMLDGLQYYSPS